MNGDTKILSALTEAEITAKYRPFLLSEEAAAAGDWVSELELDAVTAFVEEHRRKEDYKPLKFLVLYGSLREWYLLCPWGLI
jgi:arsenic resistance protein ArsH